MESIHGPRAGRERRVLATIFRRKLNPANTGDGIDYFLRRRNNHEGYSTPSFWVTRVDGTSTDFSYLHAVRGQPKGRGQELYDACRDAVQVDLARAKAEFFREHGNERGWVQCEMTGNWVTSDDAHLDHAWPSFGQVVAMFRAARGWSAGIPDGALTAAQDAQTKTRFIESAGVRVYVRERGAARALHVARGRGG